MSDTNRSPQINQESSKNHNSSRNSSQRNIWYAHYIGDYGRDTAHLSLVQHGAYRLLLDHYYSTAAQLPGDATALYRICRAFDETERKAVDFVVAEFFELRADGYHNSRADLELARQADIRERLSNGAKKAMRNRWGSNKQANKKANKQAVAKPQPQPHKEAAAETAAAAAAFWKDCDVAPTRLPGDFVNFCEDLLPTRNGRPLGEFMGLCMDGWQQLGKNIPRLFAQAAEEVRKREKNHQREPLRELEAEPWGGVGQ